MPTELGEYVVKVYIEEDEKYQTSEAKTSFSIIMLAIVLCGLLLGLKKQITKFTQEPEE